MTNMNHFLIDIISIHHNLISFSAIWCVHFVVIIILNPSILKSGLNDFRLQTCIVFTMLYHIAFLSLFYSQWKSQ